jgi:VanZ family protein
VKLLRFLPAVAWAATIFVLSHQPQLPHVSFAFEGIDKLIHAGVYGTLTLSLLLADGVPRRAWLWAVAAALYGVTDELHQSFVPGRQADVMDLVADVGGATLAAALWTKRKLQGVPRDHRL